MSKEEMREGFEAWHCEQYKTKHMTGAPTRDLHGGVYDEKYGPPKQQALWECWQETGGDVAKVEALKNEIERVEDGLKPAAVLYKDGTVLTKEECGTSFDICCKVETPLFTRSDAAVIDRLNTVVEQQKNLIASLRAELRESHSITTIPDGYCVMPRRLTAENGAKALLIGEFKVHVTQECRECAELDEPDENCEICDGEGEYCQHHTISWDQIKFIYSKAVEGLADHEENGAPAAVECTSCDGSGEYIDAIGDWRGYCSCSAGIELKNRPAVGATEEQKCETCHDQGEVFVSKGKVEYGMLTEPDPIYEPCPDCAEPANKESAQ